LPEHFRAIAADFDGTLAAEQELSEDLLAALGETRRQGRIVLLVTGRILSELYEVFPTADEHFDGIVAENGAVLSVAGTPRVLAAPVDFELDEALVERAVTFRRGQVLLATHADYEQSVAEEIRRLGLECQMIRNRGELMILPPGVSKGFGVFHALGDLGVSHHNAIGVGDAENDHSLLAVCEIGVAVGNAVDGLKRHADLVLEEPNGAGVAAMLRGPLLEGKLRIEPRRWQVPLGRYVEGGRATIPGSQINLLITGPTKAGKSFLTGILAERLIGLGYSVCVIDPEGDYAHLERLHGVLRIGAGDPLASSADFGRLVQSRFGSVIIDASQIDESQRGARVREILGRVHEERRQTGLPHWHIVDEAHIALSAGGRQPSLLDLQGKGHCVVTYDPVALPDVVWENLDLILALPMGEECASEGADRIAEALEKWVGADAGAALASLQLGQALLLRRGEPPRILDLARQAQEHVRHWHKYVETPLPTHLRFVFRDRKGRERQVARNLAEFRRALLVADPDVVSQHAERGDFSKWIRGAFRDFALAQTVRALEKRFGENDDRSDGADRFRADVVRVLEERYVG
jgi:hypothetical protein